MHIQKLKFYLTAKFTYIQCEKMSWPD